MKWTSLSLLFFISLTACTDDDGVIDPDDFSSWRNLTVADGLISDAVLTSYTDSNNNIWIGTDEGIVRYDGEEFFTFSDFNNTIGLIEAITEGLDGTIYAGSTNGLGIYANGDWTFFNGFEGIDFPFGVISLFTDVDGNIWMGTTFLGLLVFDGAQFTPVPFQNCVNCNIVNTFFQDSSDNLWIGTENGLIRFDGNGFDIFREVDGLPDSRIRALDEDQWGRLWIGTIEGVNIGIYENGAFDQVSLSNTFGFNTVLGIEEDTSGTIWIGLLSEGGLVNYDGAVARTNRDTEGPGDTRITSVTQGPDGTISIATLERGLWLYSPN